MQRKIDIRTGSGKLPDMMNDTGQIPDTPAPATGARPRIVVLDAWATNPGDLSWAPIEALGECIFHDRTPATLAAERVRDADAVFLNKAPLGAAAIEAAPRLRYVGILATGYNTIDLVAARRRGIVVSNVPGYSTMSVAQQTFALLLEITNRTGLHVDDARAGGWSRHPDYCRALSPLTELAGLVLGIVGLGAIGTAVARIGLAFGMKVLAVRAHPGRPMPPGVEEVPIDRLLAESDVVSLHCPLTDATRGIIGADAIARMKPTAILLNTSRGPLIDEPALAAALRDGRLAAAGLDVLSAEPPSGGNPLLDAPNCWITPHIAWATKAARIRLIDEAAANYRAFLAGHPVHTV